MFEEEDLANEQEAEMEEAMERANKWFWDNMTSENSFGWQGAYADQI